MTERKPVECWLTDMDGVLVHEEQAIPGAADFIERLVAMERRFLLITNNSIYTPRDLRARLSRSGINVPEEVIWTSALATAAFLADQGPGGSAYALGEAGLTTALYDIGYTLTEIDPDYVVLGENRTLSLESITKAIRFVAGGARFIATNPDPSGPSREGLMLGTGSVAALITKATGRHPYFIGKPNPIMMRSALNRIDAHSETTVMVGDRMDTDIISGLEAGLRTVLVLTGSTQPGHARDLSLPAHADLRLHRRRRPTRRRAQPLSPSTLRLREHHEVDVSRVAEEGEQRLLGQSADQPRFRAATSRRPRWLLGTRGPGTRSARTSPPSSPG